MQIINSLIDLFMQNPLAQCIGFVALITSFISLLQNNRKHIMYINSVACFIYMVHFFMLASSTGAVLNLLSGVRNILFANDEKMPRIRKYLPGIFCVAFLISTVFSWQGIISILPLAGCFSYTIGFYMKNPTHLRRISIISPPCWLTYNLINNSWAGVISEIINISSFTISMVRYDFKKKN